MAEKFDAYFKWLAISPEDQPPHYYQLLGIAALTEDADVIDNAGERQAAHVKTFKKGEHAAYAERLLEQIAKATTCLLDPEKKKAYDSKLKAKLAADAPKPESRPSAKPQSKPPSKRTSDKKAASFAAPQISVAGVQASPRPSGGRTVVLASVFIALLVAVGSVYWFVFGAGGQDEVVNRKREGNAKVVTVRPDTGSESPEVAPPKSPSAQPTNETSAPSLPEDPSEAEEPAPAETVPDEDPTETTLPVEPTNPVPPSDPPEETPLQAPPTQALPPIKLAVPTEVEQKKAGELINELYADQIGAAKTTEQKAQLAETLLNQAKETGDDPVGRYVLLTMARDFAVEAADFETALETVARIADQYEIDASEMRFAVTSALVGNVKGSAANEQLALKILSEIDQAIANDQYDSAKKLAAMAMAAARKTSNNDVKKAAVVRGREIDEIAAAYADIEGTLAELKDRADDPDANLAAGSFYCFVKGDWPRGLPMLAAGNDTKLQEIAELDISAPPTPESCRTIADDWWEIAVQQQGVARRNIQMHAAEWALKQYVPREGLFWIKWQKRIKSIPGFNPPGAAVAAAPNRVIPKKPSVPDNPEFASIMLRVDEFERRHRSVPRPQYAERVFEAEHDFKHYFGDAEEDGWSATPPKNGRKGALVYGPYLTDIPAGGPHMATFRFMAGPINQTWDVIHFEVYDTDHRRVLASRVVNSRDITQPMQYMDVPLHFFSEAGHRIEFRAWWPGKFYVKVDRVTLRPSKLIVPQSWDMTFYELLPLRGGRLEDPLWREVLGRDPIGQRHVSQMIYRWGWPRGQAKLFAVVATTELALPPGRYRFTTVSDDGVRVLINNQIAINRFTPRAAHLDSVPLKIQRGERKKVKLEYFNSFGMGTLQVWIEPES